MFFYSATPPRILLLLTFLIFTFLYLSIQQPQFLWSFRNFMPQFCTPTKTTCCFPFLLQLEAQKPKIMSWEKNNLQQWDKKINCNINNTNDRGSKKINYFNGKKTPFSSAPIIGNTGQLPSPHLLDQKELLPPGGESLSPPPEICVSWYGMCPRPCPLSVTAKHQPHPGKNQDNWWLTTVYCKNGLNPGISA